MHRLEARLKVLVILSGRSITLDGGEDGKSWRVKEKGQGVSFRLHVTGTVSRQMGLGVIGEHITDEMIQPVVVGAIQDYIGRFERNLKDRICQSILMYPISKTPESNLVKRHRKLCEPLPIARFLLGTPNHSITYKNPPKAESNLGNYLGKFLGQNVSSTCRTFSEKGNLEKGVRRQRRDILIEWEKTMALRYLQHKTSQSKSPRRCTGPHR